MSLTYETLLDATRSAAAIRAVTRLQPAGGVGDKVFPPTYAVADRKPTRYAVEERRINGQSVPTVLLDSVASQANRLEMALLGAWRDGELTLPVVEVDFSAEEGLTDLASITSLEAPHRVADAILRDSVLPDTGEPFRTSAIGRSFVDARPRWATPMYKVCPHALVFGIWDSTGPKGGLGAKFQRVLVSEIIGVQAVYGVKTASRIDPAAIESGPKIYESRGDAKEWVLDEGQAKQVKGKPKLMGKEGKPSEINHGNVAPSVDDKAGGVTFDYAQQTVVLSLTGLRHLRFPTDIAGGALQGAALRAAQSAARANLAALALAAVVLARRDGFHLRSRALLVPEAPLDLEILDGQGGEPQRFSLSPSQALALLEEAGQRAGEAGMGWPAEPVVLRPAPKLAALIRKSRELSAAKGTGE